MKIILILFKSIHSSLVDYDFTNAVGQVVLDTSGNENHAVLGPTLLEEASDPVLTDRGAYFTSATYIQLPPNSLLPLNSVALTNFYGVMFVYIISSGAIFTVTSSSTVKLKVQHAGSTITFYQYVLLSGSASDSLALNTWKAVFIGYNFLNVGSCISTSLSIKVTTESSSLSGLPLSSTYDMQLGFFTGLTGFSGFISEFHLYDSSECTTAYATHAGATFPSSYSSPYTSGTGASCSCGIYSCTGSPLVCIQCDTSCEYYCDSSSACIDIVGICKPYAIMNGVCDTSTLYIDHCKTQQSSLICSSCDSGYYLSADQSTCCQLGYYFVSSQICLICDSSCASCSGAGSAACLTCVDPNASSISGTCTCNTYYFYNSLAGSCASCLTDCSTCNSISTCLTCKDSNAVLDSSSLCACPNGFYDDPGTTALDCLSCHSSCATCSGAGSAACLTCVDPNASSISGTCTCNTYYFYNSLSSICEVCYSDCLSCVDSTINGCSQCIDTNSELLFSPGACTCKIGYFLTSSNPLVCSSCHDTCSTCSGILISQCTACSDPLASLNLGVCECQMGLYFNDVWQCVNCFVDCKSCVGSGSLLCTTCNDVNAVIDTVPGICKCLPGYAAAGQNPLICSPCFTDCATCSGLTLNECTSCVNLDAVLDNGQCVCGPGFSLSSLNPLTCTACYKLCKLCSGPSDSECLDCVDPFALVQNGKCLCQSGYYFNITTLSCNKCESFCSTCQSSETCDQCESGYFLNNTQCIACHPSCETCTGEDFQYCTSCKNSSITPSSIPGQCDCKSGEYTNTLSPLSCLPCSDSCIRCSISECFECTQGFSPQGVSCSRNELTLSIKSFSNSTLLFLFSESLSTKLKSSDFESKIDEKKLNFTLTQQNSSAYGVAFDSIDFTADKMKVSIKFIKTVTSFANSLLKQTQFSCYIENPYSHTVHTPYIMQVSVSALSKTLVFAGISSVFIRNKNGSVWISLNTIQMLSYIPLFNIEIPDILKFFLMGVRPIAILPNPFVVFSKISCSTPEIPQNFQDYGFTCKSFILNSGEMFLFFILGLLFSVVFLVLYFLPCKVIENFAVKKLKNYKYSYFVRFWIQGYTDVALNTVVSLSFLSAATKFEEADSTFTIFSSILLSASPIAIIIFYIKKKSLINQKDLHLLKTYSPLFKDFNLSLPYSYFLPLFFIFRLTFVTILLTLRSRPVWQIGISCLMQVVNLYLIIKFKVLKRKWEYWLYLLEESLILIIFLMVGLFLFSFSSKTVSYICYSIIIIVAFAILTGFLVSMLELLYNIKRKCKRQESNSKNSSIVHIVNDKHEATHEKYIDNQQLEISRESINPAPKNSISNYPSTTVIEDKLTVIKRINRAPSFIYQKIHYSN